MCFRPANVDGEPTSVICPSCEKKISAIAGVLPESCPFCGSELPELGATTPPSAPGAPAAPGAPGAPSTPIPPKPVS